MPFEYHLSVPERLLRVVATGPLDFEVCSKAIAEMSAQLEGETGFGILVDLRTADYISAAGEMRTLASMVHAPNALRTHRFAIVTSTPVMFGLGRMFSAYLELLGGESDVFRAMEPAAAWLNRSGVS